MTLKELKETVHKLIGRARTKDAIDEIEKWAKDNHQEQLKRKVASLKGNLTSLNGDKMIGILSNSEANLRQNQIVNNLLNLLDSIDDNNPPQTRTGDNTIITPAKPAKLKILMLTANPASTAKLNLDKEHAVIAERLQLKQDYFKIIRKKAVSGTEFKQFTQQEKPSILHFSGHGEKGKYAGIVVHNDEKNEEELISIPGLKALFKLFKKRFNISVVLLNACYTQDQAAVISKYVDYVIGTNVAIGDTAASAFSSGFYFQLAEDNPMNIEDAFDSGRAEAVVKGAAEENFVIYKNGNFLEID